MKYVFFLFLIIALHACQMPTPQQSHDFAPMIRTYFEHFNRHDWTKLAAMYTDSATFKDPSFGNGTVQQSRADFIKKYTELQQMFPDIHDSVVAIYPSGDKHVTIEFVSSGTGPDGKKFVLPICTVLTVDNGLITHDYTYYDNM